MLLFGHWEISLPFISSSLLHPHVLPSFLYFLFYLRCFYPLVRPAKWRNQGGQSHKSQEIKISTTFSPEKCAPPPRSFCSVREVKSGEELDDLIFSLSFFIYFCIELFLVPQFLWQGPLG